MKLHLKTKYFSLLALGVTLFFFSCSKDDDLTLKDSNQLEATSPSWPGKLIYDGPTYIHEYDFATKSNPGIIDGRMPYRMPNGNTLFIGGFFSRLEMISFNWVERTEFYNAGEPNAIYAPKLSPDGTRIAFSHRKVSNQSIFPVKKGTVIFDMHKYSEVGIPDVYHATWLPDGRLVVTGDFSSDGISPSIPAANAGLYIATITGNTATLANINPTLSNLSPIHPASSPDGKRVAFIINKHVWTINLDGTNLKQLTTSDSNNDNRESYPTWSPDGKFIAVWSNKTFENANYSAIAIVPSEALRPIVLRHDIAIWPRDQHGSRLRGEPGTISWR